MTTAEEIENVLRANSYERDFFVRIETPHGEPALSSKRVTIVDIKKAAQALSEHSTKEPVAWLCEKGEGRSKQTHIAWNELERAWYEDKDYTTTPLIKKTV